MGTGQAETGGLWVMSCRRVVVRSSVLLFQPTMPVNWRQSPSIADRKCLLVTHTRGRVRAAYPYANLDLEPLACSILGVTSKPTHETRPVVAAKYVGNDF